MMWNEVMDRVMTLLLADSAMAGLFGGHIRAASQSGSQQVPGLEWTLIGDTEGELWAPIIVQFDIWTAVAREARLAEFRLRALFHRDLPVMLADLLMWAQYEEGSILAIPDRSNFVGRAVRFRLTPLRRQYAFLSGGGVDTLPPPGDVDEGSDVLPPIEGSDVLPPPDDEEPPPVDEPTSSDPDIEAIRTGRYDLGSVRLYSDNKPASTATDANAIHEVANATVPVGGWALLLSTSAVRTNPALALQFYVGAAAQWGRLADFDDAHRVDFSVSDLAGSGAVKLPDLGGDPDASVSLVLTATKSSGVVLVTGVGS